MLRIKREIQNVKNRLFETINANKSFYGSSLASKPGELERGGGILSPVVTRISADFTLSEVRSQSAGLVESFLTENGIPHWITDEGSSAATIFSMSRRYYAVFLKSLRKDSRFKHWYIQPLSAGGNLQHDTQLVSSLQLEREVRGLSLYEVVAPTSRSYFKSTNGQGVEIHFWASNDDGDFESRVKNPIASVLPHPEKAPESFRQSLDETKQPLIDSVQFPIDAVYTWVDGSDEVWQESKANVAGAADVAETLANALDDARFADHDELRYSIRSIEQYAPWIRNIWIVTAGQTPEWLRAGHSKVKVISHEELWPSAEGLPNFNSHAIESCLHRIPGLSENFLYFNDDVMLVRPVEPELFFHGNGISKFFYSRAQVDFLPYHADEIASTTAAKNARKIIAQEFGRLFNRKFFHTCAPLNKGVMEEMQNTWPNVFQNTQKAQFRQKDDVAASGSLYYNYAHAKGKAVPGTVRYDYIDPATPSGRQRLESVIQKRNMDIICINDGASDEDLNERLETDRYIRRMLADFLPVRGTFEKD